MGEVDNQQCRLTKHQLEKVYEKNNTYLQTINSRLEPNEKLTLLSSFCHESAETLPPEEAEKIRNEESISMDLIGDTLQQFFAEKSQKKLSNDTVDAIIKLSQSGKVSKMTEVELLEVAKENRPQGQKLAKLLERAKKQLLNDQKNWNRINAFK